jgi:hypothetical protein
MKRILKLVLSPLVVVSLSPLAACYVEPGPGPGVAPPPPQQQVAYVDAPPAPPPPQPDPPPPPAPGPDYTWVPGYQRWNGRGYDWQPAHYEHQPRPGARWQQGRWEQRGNSKVWVDGGWS